MKVFEQRKTFSSIGIIRQKFDTRKSNEGESYHSVYVAIRPGSIS